MFIKHFHLQPVSKYAREVWEFVKDAPMGKGHRNEHKPFDITTANYLRPVFKAFLNPAVHLMVFKAGVKSLKTFTLECCVAHHCAYGTGDIGMYLADLDAAKDHSKSRLWQWFWGIKELEEMRLEIGDRNDETTTAI